MSFSCLTPIYAHGRQLPCGKCGFCLRKRSLEWNFRLTEEAQNWRTTSFVTLTYDEKHFPTDGSVSIDVCQRFLKRLRKQGVNFKYYLVSEYGPQTLRPHYHVIFFHDLDPEFFYDRVETAWGNGLISLGDVNEARINYVANYHITKTFVPSGRSKTFCLMSKCLGVSYLTSSRLDFFRNSGQMYVRHYDGYRLPLPRYYKEKINYSPEQIEVMREIIDKQSLIDDSNVYKLNKYQSKIDAYVTKKLKGRSI